MAYYRFDDSQGTALADLTLNAYGGTLTNMAGDEFDSSAAVIPPDTNLANRSELQAIFASHTQNTGLNGLHLASSSIAGTDYLAAAHDNATGVSTTHLPTGVAER